MVGVVVRGWSVCEVAGMWGWWTWWRKGGRRVGGWDAGVADVRGGRDAGTVDVRGGWDVGMAGVSGDRGVQVLGCGDGRRLRITQDARRDGCGSAGLPGSGAAWSGKPDRRSA
ncbi:hypothetical protein D5S19_19685 [Amycolatopsis panacis]|uniref:Uncharacterized protein n=1 Tax=Amycolatopsis panacis TaxID=2340917 RepID=A0A419I1E6_9PSEU|nr:hypothetical protein D5S19_19685 [Amycolatopsis panacis]